MPGGFTPELLQPPNPPPPPLLHGGVRGGFDGGDMIATE